MADTATAWTTGEALTYKKFCGADPSAGPIVMAFDDAAKKFCWNATGSADTAGYICEVAECQSRVSARQVIPAGNEDSTDLANKPIACPVMTYLNNFVLDKISHGGSDYTAYAYQCCALPNGRTCTSEQKETTAADYTTGVKGNANKLAAHPVECSAAGQTLSQLSLSADTGASTWKYGYTCCDPDKKFATCRTYSTPQVHRGNNFEQANLADLPVRCPPHTFLSSVKYIPSSPDTTDSLLARYSFTCCSYAASTQNYENMYIPRFRLTSNLIYTQLPPRWWRATSPPPTTTANVT